MTRRRTLLTAGAAVLMAAGSAGAGYAAHREPPAPKRDDLPGVLATVRRGDLAKIESVDGKLGFGDPVRLEVKATGTVTWLPGEGTAVGRGGTLVRVDDDPVVLLFGSMPFYRDLGPGTKGADVAQLEQNLAALGFRGFTADHTYSASTASAVRAWQRKLGRPPTGTVSPSWAVVLPGQIRVESRTAVLGGAAGGEVLSYTGAVPLVTLAVAADAGWSRPGVPVRVVLPGDKEVAGTVAGVGGTITKSDDGGSTVPVTVAFKDPKVVGRLRSGTVTVRYTGEERRGVLTVPGAALLALAEGGYGLEIVTGRTSRVVAVQAGLFADGQVEVSGAGLAEGMSVGMPS